MRGIFVIIVTFSCFLLALAQQQQRVLKSKFEGSLVYDSLVCGMGLENGEYVECPGAYCKDDSSWIFNISDSVYREYRSFNFFGYLKAPTEISYVHPCFRLISGSESIPWRSLSVNGKINEIREKYKVPSIPYSYLIYPRKMKVERVEIRDEKDKVKIENL